MGPGRAEVAQSQDHRTEEIVPFVCEDKRGWNFDKLCNPKDMLSRCPLSSEKHCAHPHTGRGVSTEVCEGVFSGGIPDSSLG